MSGFTYFIKADVQGRSSVEQLAGAAGQADTALNKLGADAHVAGAAADNAGRRGSESFGSFKSTLIGLLAQIGLVTTAMASINTAVDTKSLNNAIIFTGGEQGVQNLANVNQAIADLKLPQKESLEGFKTLSGGLMGTGITAEQQMDIFKGVSEGMLVMGGTADETKGALLALSQMASKGTVSAEELKGQLGERLPGAFNIAAKAMGVSQTALMKMMEQGDLMAKDFLPKFAAELHKTFGPGVQEALDSPRAKFNEMSNAIYNLKNTLGNELMPTATGLISNFLIPAAKWIGDNINVLGLLAVGIGGVWAALKIYAAAVEISAFVTGGFATSITALTDAFYANPIGFTIGAIVALSAVVIYAWNKFEGFRSTVVGIWSVIQEFGSIIYDYAIAPLMALGKTLIGVFTFDPTMIAQGIADGVKAVENIANSASIGERMGSAFTNGWNSQIEGLKDPRSAFENARDDRQGALANAKFSKPGASKDPNADKAKKISDTVAGGGQKNITINVNKLVESITLNTTNMKEGADEITDIITKTLLQVLNSANQVQVN